MEGYSNSGNERESEIDKRSDNIHVINRDKLVTESTNYYYCHTQVNGLPAILKVQKAHPNGEHQERVVRCYIMSHDYKNRKYRTHI